jgi:hypothetical protein
MVAVSLAELVATALLGTARRSVPDVLTGDLAPLAGEGSASPERRLLRAAGVLGVYETAGAIPGTIAALPTPAPSPDAAEHMGPRQLSAEAMQMFTGPYRDALPEWLTDLAARGHKLRPELFVAALTVGAQDRDLAVLIDAVLPVRARWLAEQHPDWEWARGGDPHDRWQTGSRAARQHLLHVLRATHPQAARELLASTWPEEQVRDRESFLAALADGLSLADEPFLEAVLDSRQPAIRTLAGRLLSALPDSALSTRMAARLAPLIRTDRTRLSVELPERELDASMRRDGLTDTPPGRMGARTWVLAQLTARAPLCMWEQAAGCPPALVRLPIADGLDDVLRDGWRQAALRQRNRRWAQALLETMGETDLSALELLAVTEPTWGQEFAGGRLSSAGAPLGERLVARVPGPWSPTFTLAVAEHLLGPSSVATGWRLLGIRGDPACAARIEDGLSRVAADSTMARCGRAALAVLTFRQHLHTPELR